MGDKTGISWCDHTFNPWIGCTKVSEGCAHCYAQRENKLYKWVEGWGRGAPRRLTSEANWKKPLRWVKEAVEARVVRRVFCASLADVFDDEVPQEWREKLWNMIDACAETETWHQCGIGLEWLILTKRPENIAKMLPRLWQKFPPGWVRIGVSVEDQVHSYRLGQLLDVWKGHNFISVEPMLSSVHLGIGDCPVCGGCGETGGHYFQEDGMDTCEGCGGTGASNIKLDWAICGCESGPGARSMDVDWVRLLRDNCHLAEVPFFLKQMAIDGKLVKEPELDGRQWLEFPEVR